SPLLRKRKESDTDSETSQSALRKRSVRNNMDRWDPSRLGKETLFILGSRANKDGSSLKKITASDVLDSERHLTIALIIEETDLLVGTVHTIEKEDLSIWKVCVKLVPKVLSEEKNLLRVLGLGHVLGKSRLFIKHPQLFKYCSDQQDQDWLASNKHTLVSVASNRVYIMLLDEIRELANSDEY
ncbi:Deoxynucleotidyltransferase terminal-interacting protein 1, partial [Homalodisca vitripennis]